MSYKLNPYTGKPDYYKRVMESLPSAPTNPYEGQIYVNDLDDCVYIYYGGQWNVLHDLTPLVTFDTLLTELGEMMTQENASLLLLDQ